MDILKRKYMLQYPSILGVKKVPLGNKCVAFYKYDGSNLRFEWSPKKGWNKFGSRTQIIDRNHNVFGSGIDIFMNEMADIITDRLKYYYPKQFKNIDRITAFAEFFGENSFAGYHEEKDIKKLKLFDVFLFQKGFIEPDTFIDIFGDWEHCAEVVYKGNLNHELIEKVRYNTLDTPLFEGVICKGMNDKIKFKKEGSVWMTKIKTFEYINKLKHKFDDKWENFSE
jgi:hypothetical protein